MIGKLYYVVGLCVMSMAVYASDVSVKTSFSHSKISINQNVNLTISIENSNDSPQFDFQELLDVFVAIGKNSETYYRQTNSKIDVGTKYIFALKPVKSGSFDFEKLDVLINGQRYRSTPLHIDITDAGPVVASEKPKAMSKMDQLASQYGFFAVAQLDKTEVYFGEKIEYTLDFYHRSHLFNVGAPNPDFSSFLADTKPTNTTPQETTLAGRRFYKTRLQSATLYPVNSGDLTIAAVPIEFLSGSLLGGVRTVNTNPVTIHVKPLPVEGKPAQFSGAVGQFSLKGSVDKSEVDQYSPITLSLFIYGEGNLSAIQDIYFNKDETFKIYQSKSELASLEGVEGRLFEYIIVPNKSGNVVLPEFYLPYFSPQEKIYKELKTSPFKLVVSPSTVKDTSSQLEEEVAQDIHYLKQLTTLKNTTVKAFDSIALLSVLFFGLATLLGQLGWKFRHKFMYQKSNKVIIQQRYTKALKELDAFKTMDTVSVVDIEKCLREYLSVKFGEPLTSATQEHIQQCCQQHGMSDAVLSELLVLLQEISYLAYSPSLDEGAKKGALLDKCKDIISSIQKEIKS